MNTCALSTPVLWNDKHRVLQAARHTLTARAASVRGRNAALQGAREGTNEDVTVGVVRAYDEAEDVEPRILLNISSLSGEVDTDAGPSAAEARAIAANLIEAADELDRWTAR